jgi:uncharacterized protein YcfL
MKNVLVLGVAALALVGCSKTEEVAAPAEAPAVEVVEEAPAEASAEAPAAEVAVEAAAVEETK